MNRILCKEDFEFFRRHKLILKKTLTILRLHFPLIDFRKFKRELKNIEKDFLKLNSVLVRFIPRYKQKKLDYTFDKQFSFCLEQALLNQEELSYNIYSLIEMKNFSIKRYCKSKTHTMASDESEETQFYLFV